jgi:hypothetical protein
LGRAAEQPADDCRLAHCVQVREGRCEHETDLLVLLPGAGPAGI